MGAGRTSSSGGAILLLLVCSVECATTKSCSTVPSHIDIVLIVSVFFLGLFPSDTWTDFNMFLNHVLIDQMRGIDGAGDALPLLFSVLVLSVISTVATAFDNLLSTKTFLALNIHMASCPTIRGCSRGLLEEESDAIRTAD